MPSGDTRVALFVLMGAVIFVLLICVRPNIANLLLARGSGPRERVRSEKRVGVPTRVALFDNCLTESLVLSIRRWSFWGVLPGFLRDAKRWWR